MKRTTRLLSIAFIALLFPFMLSAQHDLSVGVTVDFDTANIGANRTFTVTVYNQGATTVTGVHLSTVLTSGLTFVSATPSVGTYAANNWDIGTISAATPSVTMTIVATASAESVQTLTAQIAAMVEADGDSAPNNSDPKEDDIKVACVSVPVYYCDGATINMTATASYAGVGVTYQWYKDGGMIMSATSQTYIISAIGTYTYSATGGTILTCTGTSCCPIIVRYVPKPVLTTTDLSICNGSATDLTARVSDHAATAALSSISFYPPTGDPVAQTGALTAGVAITNAAPSAATTLYSVRKNITTNGYTCTDTKTFTITANTPALAGTAAAATTVCETLSGSGLTVDLAAKLTGETTGGVWSRLSGPAVGAELNTATGILTFNGLTVGTYVFRYTITPTSPCPVVTNDVTVIIDSCCPVICLPVTLVRNP